MRTLCILLTTLLITSGVFAQETQTVRGRVIDKDSRQPLITAKVFLPYLSTPIGAITDEKGEFRINNVPVGRQTIVCEYLGYGKIALENQLISSAKEPYLEIELIEVGVAGDTVFIIPDNFKPKNEGSANISIRKIDPEQNRLSPGTVNDPSRLAMAYAGVQASQDNNSDIIIRGNSPAGLLWRLEGIDIPNPNHFARKGSSGGGITMFSSALLGSSDFSTGAFSAEYGNAFSGAFDMRFRQGNDERHQRRFKFGLLGTDLALEGPFRKGGASYIVNYRYSTLGILNDLGFRLVGPRIDNNFQDLSFNLYMPLDSLKTSWMTVFGVGGLSEELWDPVNDSLAWSTLYRTERTFTTNMGTVGMTYNKIYNKGGYLKAVVAVMGQKVIDRDDTLGISTLSLPIPNQERDDLNSALWENEDYRNNRVSTHISYHRKVNSTFKFKTGVLASHIRFNFSHQRYIDEVADFQTLVSGEGNSNLLQGYGQFTFTPTQRLQVNGGVHTMFLTLNNTYSVEPRLSMRYSLDEKQSIGLAYGIHGRILPLGSYFTEVKGTDGALTQPNMDLEMVKSHHIVASYHAKLGEKTRLIVEGYWQYLYDVPVSPETGSSYWILNERDGYATQALVSEGTGSNLGVDVTLEKLYNNGLFFLISGSLYDSKYTMPDGRTFNTRYNGRYNTSSMIGKEFKLKEKNFIEIGARLVANGGLRYTPGDVEASTAAGEFVGQEDKAYSELLGNYFRTDARIAYRLNAAKSSWIFSIDVQNVTNQYNVKDQVFDEGLGDMIFRPQSGLIPVFSMMVDF